MRPIIFILISLLVALQAPASIEICRHASGPSHAFFGSACAGEHARQHAEGRGHETRHGNHHGHGHSQTPDDHHEPCTHELIGGDLEGLQVYWEAALSTPAFRSLGPIGVVQILPPPEAFGTAGLERPPRAPPVRGRPGEIFIATIRLLV